jgi:Protein of unknown function (DUF3489)
MSKPKMLTSAKTAVRSRAMQNIQKSAGTAEHKSSKSDAIVTLLRRKQGASLEDMQKASGWQAHSVRGFLSGTAKKRLGLNITSAKRTRGERRYTIVAA